MTLARVALLLVLPLASGCATLGPHPDPSEASAHPERYELAYGGNCITGRTLERADGIVASPNDLANVAYVSVMSPEAGDLYFQALLWHWVSVGLTSGIELLLVFPATIAFAVVAVLAPGAVGLGLALALALFVVAIVTLPVVGASFGIDQFLVAPTIEESVAAYNDALRGGGRRRGGAPKPSPTSMAF